MSNWIRIDDDTYIDDSLVTCAEYQLFIDEMREQGKYHQPDHWTDYHFPKGHARQPILGMRPTDAEEFCKWLTLWQSDGWSYRKLTWEESQKHFLSNKSGPPLGYWIKREGKNNFSWIGSQRSNPRSLNSHNIASMGNDINLIQDIEQYILNYGALNLDRDINISQARNLNPDNIRDLGIMHDLQISHSRNLSDALSFESTLSRHLVQNRDIYIDNTLNRAIAFVQALVQDRDRDITYINIIGIIVDIYTIRERIASRSPAFEGIRLVRERTK